MAKARRKAPQARGQFMFDRRVPTLQELEAERIRSTVPAGVKVNLKTNAETLVARNKFRRPFLTREDRDYFVKKGVTRHLYKQRGRAVMYRAGSGVCYI